MIEFLKSMGYGLAVIGGCVGVVIVGLALLLNYPWVVLGGLVLYVAYGIGESIRAVDTGPFTR